MVGVRIAACGMLGLALVLLVGDEVNSLAIHSLHFRSLGELQQAWPSIGLPQAGTLPFDAPAGPLFGLFGMALWLVSRHKRAAVVAQVPGADAPLGQPAKGHSQAASAPAMTDPTLTSLNPADREFLPAALEILQTPPSPIAIALLLFICFASSSALAWSYFGWLDIHAVAQGKIQPSGHSKVVQPLEPGKVVTVLVENGSRVQPGDVLLELDPTETSADREAQSRDLEAANAEAARRKVAVRIARGDSLQPLPIGYAAGTDETARLREDSVLAADLAQLASTKASLKAQLAEKLATHERLTLSIAARAKLIALARERVGMREVMDQNGAGSRALIIEALQQLETQMTSDAGDRGQLLETSAAAVSLERKIEEILAQFIADQTTKLAEAERKRDRLFQELIKAQSKSDRTRLKAPIAGTVQQLTVTTVGQVVASGQSLMTIVPLDGPIEVEVMIANKDIGFVEPGQAAVVKVEAFAFTRYGTIDGIVAKVSRDAVDDRDAANFGDATTMTKPQGAAANPSSRPQNLVFPATVTLARRSIAVDGKDVPLSPGMAVTVEVRTGQRRAIDYVLSPLREVAAGAVRER